ncbi:hypothetical protein PN499_07980 [Kamptonema animale CS-326]|jgi:DNA-directed RNA polymerase subunit RPC12/RpoP|uniref:hypothetical protein n=1 Tax=Kamptonema animale TaxID=92934 RepID=UPI0023302BA1|nr:hypothetical protein [Kamptonema animale]MDB9511117.1 hypothetical protein [Kamptonema animale CS-326]
MGMKCVQCGTDNILRDRTNNSGRCKRCNHPFVFEPTTVTDYKLRFTDPFFKKALDDISSQNILFFTPKQFLYFIDRRLKPRASTPRWLWIFIYLFFGLLVWGRGNIINAILTMSLLGLFSYGISISQKRRLHGIPEVFLVNAAQSDQWLRRWQKVNGRLEKLLRAPRQNALPASIDREVSAYSFDRAIVCDSDEIAQFLIANNIHFENNCAILSISGYPRSIFKTVIQMLRRNPDLKVYALHNASPIGVSLVHQLRTNPDWFANQEVTIFDLGISPRQILENRNLFVQKSVAMAETARQLPDTVRQSLTAKELAWLDAGNFVELESFTPQRLLRVVNYGLAQSGDPQSNNGLILVDNNVEYGGGYVFMSDSFG